MSNLFTKILKKLAIILALCITVLLLIFFAGSYKRYSDKKSIRNLVLNEMEFLNQCIETEAYEKIAELHGVSQLVYRNKEEETVTVEYLCESSGIASSGWYAGFYYSSEDIPLGLQGISRSFIEKGKGWKWQEENGDNYEYIERITDHWYYYESGF